jgi:chemotaxis receptor (MCP) glutamine deamidase CheD
MYLVSLEVIPPDIQHMRRRSKGHCLEVVNLRIVAGSTRETLERDIEAFRQEGRAWVDRKSKPA